MRQHVKVSNTLLDTWAANILPQFLEEENENIRPAFRLVLDDLKKEASME